MPSGEAFSARQQEEIRGAIDRARRVSGLVCSVYVGDIGADPRDRAIRLHAALADAADAVLVAVDPGNRRVEIVTGHRLRPVLDDRSCALAALSMSSAFSTGDLVGGITTGVAMLADHARRPQVLHTEQPQAPVRET